MRRIPLAVVAVLILAGVAASVSGADTTTTTTTSPTTTTTVVHRRVAALTGLPDPTAVTKRRSALTIKMDNTPEAHPSTASTKPTSSTRRSSRVASPAWRLSSTRNCRPRSVRCGRCVVPTARSSSHRGDLRLLRGRPVRHQQHRDGAGKADRSINAGAAMFRDPTRRRRTTSSPTRRC